MTVSHLSQATDSFSFAGVRDTHEIQIFAYDGFAVGLFIPAENNLVPVGMYLFAAGYDPDAIDLPDFSFRIDFRDALLYLRIADWQDEYIYSLYD